MFQPFFITSRVVPFFKAVAFHFTFLEFRTTLVVSFWPSFGLCSNVVSSHLFRQNAFEAPVARSVKCNTVSFVYESIATEVISCKTCKPSTLFGSHFYFNMC